MPTDLENHINLSHNVFLYGNTESLRSIRYGFTVKSFATESTDLSPPYIFKLILAI